MTELIEVVARAICHDEWTTPGTDLKPEAIARVVEGEWEHWSSAAQAALTAITDAGYRIVKDEVVAFRYGHNAYPDDFGSLPLTDGHKKAGWIETPLYAAPGDEK